MRHAILALAALVLLAGCDSTQSLEDLRAVAPPADAYQAALAADYRAFSEEAATDYDWSNSSYFADKGLMAAYGRDITPEEPTQWDITASAPLGELAAARSKLIAVIAENKITQPSLTAETLVGYDRWIVLQSADEDSTKIKEARESFFARLGRLEVAQAAEPGTNPPSSEPALLAANKATAAPTTPVTTGTIPVAPPAPEATPALTKKSAPATPVAAAVRPPTIIYFPFDSDGLGNSATAALAEVVKYVASRGTTSVTINGHTDRAGTEAYNMKLSERRARTVEEALKKAGIPEKLMQYFAFGETDPAVPTADGVREPRNRRVEIFIE